MAIHPFDVLVRSELRDNYIADRVRVCPSAGAFEAHFPAVYQLIVSAMLAMKQTQLVNGTSVVIQHFLAGQRRRYLPSPTAQSMQ
jgi:hypothetical protein